MPPTENRLRLFAMASTGMAILGIIALALLGMPNDSSAFYWISAQIAFVSIAVINAAGSWRSPPK